VELDPDLSETHVALGLVRMYKDRDWPSAERELSTALYINKSSSDATNLYAFYLQTVGRLEDAIRYREHAMLLDPDSPTVKRHAAITYSLNREFEKAIGYFKELIDNDPKNVAARMGLAFTYVYKGEFLTGIGVLKEITDLDNDLAIATLAYAYAKSGQRNEAEKLRGELLAKRHAGEPYVSPFALAIACVALGDKDAAFDWLDKAYEERSPNMALKVHPLFEGLRSDPRFEKLLKQNGF